MRINKETLYMERKSTGGLGRKATMHHRTIWRDWYLIKYSTGECGQLAIPNNVLMVPKEYIGKRVRFKMEILEEKVKK